MIDLCIYGAYVSLLEEVRPPHKGGRPLCHGTRVPLAVMLLDWRPFWIGLDRSNWISLFAPELNLARQSLDQIRKCPSSGLDWIESPIQLQSNPITSLHRRSRHWPKNLLSGYLA